MTVACSRGGAYRVCNRHCGELARTGRWVTVARVAGGVSRLATGSTADGLVVSKLIVQRLFGDGEFEQVDTVWAGKTLVVIGNGDLTPICSWIGPGHTSRDR